MVDLLGLLSDKFEKLTLHWVSLASLGGFLIYLFGYLSLRFHLTAFGITGEAAVLDERYLFAGNRFLIYLLMTIPIIVLLCLLMAGLGCLFFYLPYRFLPAAVREKIDTRVVQYWVILQHWWSSPTRLALVGVVLSVVLIQLLMRRCLVFSNLLLRESLPGPEWLQALLLDKYDGLRSLFFAGLVAGVGASGGLLLLALHRTTEALVPHLLTVLLAVLIAIQILLLPVNHGILITDLTVPRVASVLFDDGKTNLSESDQDIWQVGDEQEALTFLVRDKRNTHRRALITLPRKNLAKIEISRFEPVLSVLFNP